MTLYHVLAIALVTLPGLAIALRPDRAPDPGVPATPARLSALSVLSFVSGLGALLVGLASVVTSEVARHRYSLNLGDGDANMTRLASEVLVYIVFVPAVAAFAFALAARGAIREGRGALRGSALYRAAVLLALVVGLGAFERLRP
jgi:hypothetical protein